MKTIKQEIREILILRKKVEDRVDLRASKRNLEYKTRQFLKENDLKDIENYELGELEKEYNEYLEKIQSEKTEVIIEDDILDEE